MERMQQISENVHQWQPRNSELLGRTGEVLVLTLWKDNTSRQGVLLVGRGIVEST